MSKNPATQSNRSGTVILGQKFITMVVQGVVEVVPKDRAYISPYDRAVTIRQ